MISMSQLAASVLFTTLKESKVRCGQSLRLVREKEGLVLQLDDPVQTDRVIKFKGSVVLTVNKDLENELGNARIDIEDSGDGCDLVIRRTAILDDIDNPIKMKS